MHDANASLESQKLCDNCKHIPDMDQSAFSNSMIVIIAKLVIAVALKFWRACTAGVLILLLCFWLYGSLVAFSLLIIAICGEWALFVFSYPICFWFMNVTRFYYICDYVLAMFCRLRCLIQRSGYASVSSGPARKLAYLR